MATTFFGVCALFALALLAMQFVALVAIAGHLQRIEERR